MNFAKLIIILEKNIREVIAKNGGIMPEDMPTPEKSLKELEKEKKTTNKINR